MPFTGDPKRASGAYNRVESVLKVMASGIKCYSLAA